MPAQSTETAVRPPVGAETSRPHEATPGGADAALPFGLTAPSGARDRALVARIVAGEQEALAALYDCYGRLVFSQAARLLGSRETAEEVTQDVFLVLWRRAALYDADRASLHTWLLSITHHRAVDQLRRQRARPQVVDDLANADRPGTYDTWTAVSHALDVGELRSAVATLPESQRTAISLAYFGEYALPEVARQLVLPLGTVKSRIRLGLRRLRERVVRAEETTW